MFDLKKLRKEKNLKQNDVAKMLKCGQPNISAIENEGKDLTPEQMDILVSKYGREYISSLYSEEHQIPNDGTYRLVPLINIDAVAGMHTTNDVAETDPEYIISYIPFVNAQDSDLCIQVKSDSMMPTCPPGCLVQIRQVPNWKEYFGYGNLFVIQLNDGRRIIKEVAKYDANPKDYILCVSHNKSVAAEELPKNFIVSVWKVIKVLTDRGW